MRILKSKLFIFSTILILLLVLFFFAINTGSIKVTPQELWNGLFVSFDEKVAAVYNLRFPRIFIAILAGAAIATSGVLLQALLKNPLADPSVIGISSGASCVSVIVMSFFPSLYFYTPLFAFVGGVITGIIIYLLSYKSGLQPLRMILIGVAINAAFVGILDIFGSMGGSQSGVASIVNANISLKTWQDVQLLFSYVGIGLIATLCISNVCNILALEDKTMQSLGIPIIKYRLMITLLAILLASISTAVVGVISFLGLIAPHIGRIIIGSDHKYLIPFTMLLGAFILLLADTIGRIIATPYEISASIIMAIIGGPFFILLLKRSEKVNGK
ncbi:MAG: FecCD family ABC transporter permease [Coprobacillaceae bacterium]